MHEKVIFYELVVKGHIDSRRSSWFDGMELLLLEDGTTRLYGPVRDQAALHALLSRIRDLALELQAVRRIKDTE